MKREKYKLWTRETRARAELTCGKHWLGKPEYEDDLTNVGFLLDLQINIFLGWGGPPCILHFLLHVQDIKEFSNSNVSAFEFYLNSSYQLSNSKYKKDKGYDILPVCCFSL